MQRSTRFNRPTLRGSSVASVLFGRADMFTLSAAPASTTAIDLTWSASPSSPDNYRVERSLDGSSFTTVTTVGNTTFTYQDTGRTESVQYWYRIVPILGGADQEASNIADTWTVPATPTGLTATAAGQTQINLAWTDVSTGNTAQSIQRRSPAGSGSYSFIASVGATATSYSDTGLTLATQYEYQVAATNPATQSAWSTAANATTTGGGPPSPSWTLDFSTGEPWANGTNYTFSSTASTTRTFVNSSGYIAPSVANLVFPSEAFDNSNWGRNGIRAFGSGSIANAATAPDGTTTADLITEDSANGLHGINSWAGSRIPNQGAGVPVCMSVYAKKPSTNGRNIVSLASEMGSGGYCGKRFDLTTGSVVGADYNTNTTDITSLTYGIENAGNGWYRCWVSFVLNTTGTYQMRISPMVSSTTTFNFGFGDYAGDNTSGILVWGAQTVRGSAPLPYSATTTSSNGIPRLTHNSSGSRLGLLVEEQRTNLVPRSEEFNTTWVAGRMTVTANSVTAPNNTTTADTITEDTSTNTHGMYQSIGVTSGASYTLSCYIKKGTRRYVCVGFWDTTSSNSGAQFDMDTNTATAVWGTGYSASSNATMTDVGNGWYRCSVTCVAKAATDYPSVTFRSTASTAGSGGSIVENYAGSTANYAYVWGFQMEAGTTATSYIPTTTSSVTRSADIASVATSNITGFANNSTLLVEYYRPATNGMVTATNEATAIIGDTGFIGVRSVNTATQSDVAWGMGWTQSGANGNLTGTVNATLQKFAYTINSGGTILKSCMNGSMLTTTKTGDNPNMTLPDKLFLGQEEGGTLYSNVIIRKVAFYNSVLSDADMQTITT